MINTATAPKPSPYSVVRSASYNLRLSPLAPEHLAETTGRRRRSSAHLLEELVDRGLAQHAGVGYRLALPLPRPSRPCWSRSGPASSRPRT